MADQVQKFHHDLVQIIPSDIDIQAYYSVDAQMSEINRLHSPMNYCDEDGGIAPNELSRKSMAAAAKNDKSFLVGSIDNVNEKISRLDRKLQNYTKLAMEVYEEDDARVDAEELMAERQAAAAKRDKENKEMNQFAGLYAIKKTLMPGHSERVKNISKISLDTLRTNATQKESGNIKPRFAEMYQYPGFCPNEVTPLPRDTSAKYILRKVADASMNLGKKPHYREEFEFMFYSDTSQSLLKDLFWYVFVVKYQPSTSVEQQLFSRIAHQYVNLLQFSKGKLGSEISHQLFFRDYHTLMAQGVYAVFCESFPDSFRQYDADFKDYLCNLVKIWMTGTQAPTGAWTGWNFKKLEPSNIRQVDDITQVTTAKSSMTLMDILSGLGKTSATTPRNKSPVGSNNSSGDVHIENSLNILTKPVIEPSPKQLPNTQNAQVKAKPQKTSVMYSSEAYGELLFLNHATADAKTYRDVIRESLKTVRRIEKNHQHMLDKNQRHTTHIWAKHGEYLKYHREREAAILSKPNRIRRACDLLILDQMKTKEDSKAPIDLLEP